MRKIANTSELQGELRRILDIAGSFQPSRVKLAAALRELSLRVAGKTLPGPKREIVEKQLAEYGYSLSATDEIEKNGKGTTVTVTTKGPRFYALKPDGGKLWSGANLGDFVAAFWFAKKTAASQGWKDYEDFWGKQVDYASGENHKWAIYDNYSPGHKDHGTEFGVEVKTPDGVFRHKKYFDSLEKAQRFADKYIEKAHGNQLLADALDSDFRSVHDWSGAAFR